MDENWLDENRLDENRLDENWAHGFFCDGYMTRNNKNINRNLSRMNWGGRTMMELRESTSEAVWKFE